MAGFERRPGRERRCVLSDHDEKRDGSEAAEGACRRERREEGKRNLFDKQAAKACRPASE
jgi:hypothetical protein